MRGDNPVGAIQTTGVIFQINLTWTLCTSCYFVYKWSGQILRKYKTKI